MRTIEETKHLKILLHFLCSMEYKTKSAVIGRKKVAEDKYNCIINLFDVNDPHLSKKVPKEPLEFENIDHVHINGLDFKFCLMGNDIVINDLKSISIEQRDRILDVSGEQK